MENRNLCCGFFIYFWGKRITMSFKLLAIRPLGGCNPKFLKNLEENWIYKFYNDYKFIQDNDGNVTSIEYDETVPQELYYQGEKENTTKINISAIVGKNGSGKSALVELLVASILKISLDIKENFINKDSFAEQGYFESIDKSIKEDLQNIDAEIYFLHNCFSCFLQNNELECFSTKESPTKEKIKIRKVKILNSKIKEIIDFEENNEKTFDKKTVIVRQNLASGDLENQLNIHREEFHFLQDFFYTMVINYSHYGFNANEMGDWINGVFHKNDGYQLPIVINPMRTEGIIDINREKELTTSRFLVNILQENGLRTISKEKKLSYIKIVSNLKKANLKFDNYAISFTDEIKQLLTKEIVKLYNFESIPDSSGRFYDVTMNYIMLKLYKMTKYEIFKDFKNCFYKQTGVTLTKSDNNHLKNRIIKIKNKEFINYLKVVRGVNSHITEKFRQAVNFLRLDYLADYNNESEIFIEIDELFQKINYKYQAIRSQDKNPELWDKSFGTEYSLPSFFDVNFYFENNPNSENNFNNLSSGERQKIFSIHSVIYHLRNLKSVNQENELDKEKIFTQIKYHNYNIIFDEIELYAHPEFQRKFINDLIYTIDALKLGWKYEINLLFITHSPFILSDIPKQNVLFLEIESGKAKPKDFSKMNTFAANIHDLLADSFFIGDGLIGYFAKKKIKETIKFLKKEKSEINSKEEVRKIIKLIDEPFMREKLLEMYYEAFDEEKLKEEEMTRLEELAKKYNKKITDA